MLTKKLSKKEILEIEEKVYRLALKAALEIRETSIGGDTIYDSNESSEQEALDKKRGFAQSMSREEEIELVSKTLSKIDRLKKGLPTDALNNHELFLRSIAKLTPYEESLRKRCPPRKK